MRNVIWLVHTSLDGFVTGPNGEMDWIRLDDELFEDVHRPRLIVPRPRSMILNTPNGSIPHSKSCSRGS